MGINLHTYIGEYMCTRRNAHISIAAVVVCLLVLTLHGCRALESGALYVCDWSTYVHMQVGLELLCICVGVFHCPLDAVAYS